MHIRIEPRVSRGLRIIKDIPDIPICKIEGVNGVGKTSAIRLLQLLTGQQPFVSNPGAWRTFRTQLLGARVTVTEIAGAKSIDWDFSTASWPEQPELLGADQLAVRIDGKTATMSDVTGILQVSHINATQTPQEILGRQVSEAAASVADWFTVDGSSRSQVINEAIDSRLRAPGFDPSKIRALMLEAQTAKTTFDALAQQVSAKRERVADLEAVVGLMDQLEKFRGSLPDLEADIASLGEQLETLDRERETVTEAIEAARDAKHSNRQAEKKFSNAQKNVEKWRKTHAARSVDLQRAFKEARLAPVQEALDEAIDHADKKLNSLLEAQPYVDTDPIMRELLQDVVSRLDMAIATDLGALMLIDEDVRAPGWTVLGLRDACAAQLQQLMKRTPPTAGQHLAADIAACRSRLDQLATLGELTESVAESERLWRKAEDTLRQAVKGLPATGEANLEALVTRVGQIDRQAREAQLDIERKRATRELVTGGKSESALNLEIDSLSKRLGIDPPYLRSRFESESAELATVAQRSGEAEHQAKEAAREFGRHEARIKDLVADIAGSADLAWLRRAMPSAGDIQGLAMEEQLNLLDRIRASLDNFNLTVERTRLGVQGIGGALDYLAQRVAGNERLPPENYQHLEAASRWLSSEVRRWFDDEIMRDALFDGGTDPRLELDSLTLIWTTPSGAPESRGLGAFSSGEQAFAHTRSELARLERQPNPPANRLIALDEFGTTLDADRLGKLLEDLTRRQDRRPSDQILLIVPAGFPRDIGQRSGSGVLGDQQLVELGYFAEALSA